MTKYDDIEMCRVAVRELVDYWFTGERNGARFSIPVQPNDADVLLSKALDELKALREAAEEALPLLKWLTELRPGDTSTWTTTSCDWARVYDKLAKALGGGTE